MTEKQIEKAIEFLHNNNGALNEEEKDLMSREISCRKMINSIMCYHGINAPYNENTDEFDRYLKPYAYQMGGEYERSRFIGKERVLELISEQQEDFRKAEVKENVYTDDEGLSYNSIVWADE